MERKYNHKTSLFTKKICYDKAQVKQKLNIVKNSSRNIAGRETWFAVL